MTDATTVQCQTCDAEIPALAAACPTCGVDRSTLGEVPTA